jgi:hypothetical protein
MMEAPLICQIKAGLLSGYIWTLNKTKFITLVMLEYKHGQQACFDVMMSFYVLDFPGMEPDEPQITKARLPLAKVRLPALPPVIQLTTVKLSCRVFSRNTCLLKSYRFMSEVARFH